MEYCVATTSQRKASAVHRRRAAARGLVRVEVQAPKADAGLIRALAETLRSDPEKAEAVRASVRSALGNPQEETALDVFRSNLPDEAFEGVFATARDARWREVDL
jgi:hypothetical protein